MLFTFEDKLKEINYQIERMRHKWRLKAIVWMDYDDVAQMLRIHISNQWTKWDQTRPLAQWLARLVRNHTINVVRNLYMNIARPCISTSCAANEGDNKCRIYGEQCAKCPLYAKWLRNKKVAYDVKLPVSLEYHSQEVSNMAADGFDLEKQIIDVHAKMEASLTQAQFRVYKWLCVDGKTKHETAELMGYKTTENHRSPGYKQLHNLENLFLKKVKEILAANR